jgi:GMP synthase (glutamine-hydrolysing)
MRTALALTHVPFEVLGSLAEELSAREYGLQIVDACTADLRDVDGLASDLLIVLGGPIGVYETEAYPFLQCRDATACPAMAELLIPDLPVLHWHGDTFDLPPGAAHLAASALYPNQAWSIGASILGLQFHPEVLTGTLERWYVGHASELATARIDVPRLRRDGRTFGPALHAAARLFWRRWLGGLDPP